ncbi:MAG: glycosyltransferase [Thermodesulfovibrio sp.]|nr:glycosyltransferase [Thermodesulfovibrio sp.]
MDFDRNIWIVEECINPSTEYYILPALKILGFEDRIRILNSPPSKILDSNITIFFVRYLNRDWNEFVEKNKRKIKKIIYFMDDDLFDLKSWQGLPLRYIKKIYLKAFRWKKWLSKVNFDFFVSTEYLAEKYQKLNPIILPPYPIFNTSLLNQNNKGKGDIIVFYHGTASHKKEIYWLYDIVKATTEKNENIVYEFIGNNSIYNKFKSLERVIVVYPMKWNLYKNFLLTKNRHIGLVPILSNNFNRARSYTKFFEISACGGVGIYSKESCYKSIISDNTDGILVPNDKERWIETILRLAHDNSYRLKLYFNSIEKLKHLKEFAEKAYKENLLRRFE